MSVQFGPDYPIITTEIGVASAASGTGLWDSSLWDTGTWGPDVAWTDISEYVQEISTFRGRSRESDRYQTGSATLTLKNLDGRFTPANLSGPYVAGGVSQIRPRVPVRVSATWDSVKYPLFYGRVESWQDQYPMFGYNAVTIASAVDGLAELAAFDGAEQVSQGAGETSGLRIHRILAHAGWTLDTNIAPGTATMQATTLAQDAFTEAALTTDSEGGALWAEADGSIVFEDRYALIENARSNTSQVAFGTTVVITDPVVEYSSDTLHNIVAIARVGGTQYETSDLESRALYGDRAWSRNDLICEDDDQVASLAEQLLATWKAPEYRVVEATVFGVRSPAVHWPHVLGRRIRDRASVTATVHVSGVTVARNVFVDGVAHNIRNKDWSTTFYFGSASMFDGFVSSRWDEALWDTATWMY